MQYWGDKDGAQTAAKRKATKVNVLYGKGGRIDIGLIRVFDRTRADEIQSR